MLSRVAHCLHSSVQSHVVHSRRDLSSVAELPPLRLGSISAAANCEYEIKVSTNPKCVNVEILGGPHKEGGGDGGLALSSNEISATLAADMRDSIFNILKTFHSPDARACNKLRLEILHIDIYR